MKSVRRLVRAGWVKSNWHATDRRLDREVALNMTTVYQLRQNENEHRTDSQEYTASIEQNEGAALEWLGAIKNES